MIKNQGARDDQRAFTLMMQMILISVMIFIAGVLAGAFIFQIFNQL